MEYKVGDRVVYPNHGVAVVEAVDQLDVGGSQHACYRLRLLCHGATVIVPTQNTAAVGLRPTARKREASDVLLRLREGCEAIGGNWKGRYRENSDRMRSGLLNEVAEVVLSLSSLAHAQALSFREKAMLDKARELVVSEIAVVQSESSEAIATQLDAALAEGRDRHDG